MGGGSNGENGIMTNSSSDRIKEHEVDVPGGTYGGQEICTQDFLWGTLKERITRKT
jgi:hypothetical protein